MRVTLPASADTTPPTMPPDYRHEIQSDGCSFLTKWDPSTDDETPQDELQYDFVDWTGFTISYGVTSGTTEWGSGSVRAVDQAGNRSPLAGGS